MSRMMSDRKPSIGEGRKGSVFPGEVHVKEMKSPRGAGMINDYPDMEGEVYRDQEHGISKASGRKMKAGYRN